MAAVRVDLNRGKSARSPKSRIERRGYDLRGTTAIIEVSAIRGASMGLPAMCAENMGGGPSARHLSLFSPVARTRKAS